MSRALHVFVYAACAAGEVTPPMLQLPPRVSESSKFFLWFTDYHVDPYYGTKNQLKNQHCQQADTLAHKFGIVGCDPPLKLAESVAQAADVAAQSVGGVEFALFTGDYVRHKQNLMPNPTTDVLSTIADVTRTLVGTRATPISLGALGNDDSPMNYELRITTNESENPWLVSVSDEFLAAGAFLNASLGNYTYGGFREEELGGLTILTINTIIYSVRHTPRPPPGSPLPKDPFGQLAWLEDRLHHAAEVGKPVWIVSHIPPGIETYGHTELWHPEYLRAYRSILEQPSFGSAVAAQLFGHVHADEFRLLPGAPPGMGPTLLAGSLSPIYRSNPTFRLVEYEPSSGRPLNFLTYYTEVDSRELTWKLGYSAFQAYKPLAQGVRTSAALHQSAFVELALELRQAGQTWNTYAGWYKVQYINDLMYCGLEPQAGNESLAARRRCVEAYICGLTIATQDEYNACRTSHSILPSEFILAQLYSENYSELARGAHWKAVSAEDTATETQGSTSQILYP